MDGIIVMDKPAGFTSFDVIAKMRGMLGIRRLGHAGTLDPMATGVLPVLVGRATRAMDILPVQDKEYLAGFQLGITTDTLDSTGKILQKKSFVVQKKDLMEVMQNFQGEIMQIPPMYSAKQKDGVRLYDLARQGIEIEREARPCTIYELELLEYDAQAGRGVFRALCTKGTYIRTLAADIGDALRCGAILTSLRRTMAAGFTCRDALTLEQAQCEKDCGRLEAHILPVSSAFEMYPRVRVTQKQAVRFCNGGPLKLEYLTGDFEEADILTVWSPDGVFLGLGSPDFEKEELKIFKLFGGKTV